MFVFYVCVLCLCLCLCLYVFLNSIIIFRRNESGSAER